MTGSYARPSADSAGSSGSWTNQRGGTVDLFNAVKESSHDTTTHLRVRLPGSPFSALSSIPNEDSRASYTTALGTPCTNIVAHALGVNDDFHKVRLIVPNSCDLNQLTPIGKVLHGVGIAFENIITSGGFGTNGMTDAMLDLGWPVLAPREGGNTWGNEDARLGFLDIWDWISEIFTTPGYLLYGISMGGCAAINFLLDALANSIPVLCCGLNSAATNLQYTYDHPGNGLQPGIQTAYGLADVPSSDATYIAAVDTADGGHDPQKQTAAEIPQIPFRTYVGNADGTISKANNSDLWVAKLAAASWSFENGEVVYSGDHVAAASYQPTDWTDFCQRAVA